MQTQSNIPLTAAEGKAIRRQLEQLRALEGKPIRRYRLTNITERIDVVLLRAERRARRSSARKAAN